MKRNFEVYLQDILESIELIRGYMKDCPSLEVFQEDMGRQDAVMYRLSIIGEAAKRLPKQMRDENPQVPWKSISGTRDIIIHDYDNVNYKMVWDIVHTDLDALELQIKMIVGKGRQF